MNNLVINESKMIEYEVGVIDFKAYEHIKNRAIVFAEELKSVIVDEETIKESKKMLAEVNKDIKKLEDKRIAIKKEMLIPYNEFEDKVKEIVNIVKEADNIIRSQVRELEEREKEEKKLVLRNLFDGKLKHYNFSELITFEDFFEEKMSNKTTSVDKTEEQMSKWLEQRKNDIDVIENLGIEKNLILKEYFKSFNLSQAIQAVRYERQREQEINDKINKSKEIKKLYIITIEDEKDAKLAEMLLKENKIKYNMEVR